ncbi:hypothetical protein GYMLUDRAFT_242913 [Collybiopsis luxurians FD-317 M1]|uniref:Uncharacterized protein n=1 Tax=Collybiopsis luxurians FD-317 M1 TaxID=944289 RepID=A0A0D0C2A2_9AGAR|nr:hypothetical protein GYMLUDRAFT_242913 [Collybiopsis luxurians FD-317 M1]
MRYTITALSAAYTLGLMADAAVRRFEMVRGSVQGVIKEKTEAKEEHDKALPSPDAGSATSICQPFEMNVFIQQASPMQNISSPSGYPISISFGLQQSFNTPFPTVNTEKASRHPHDYAHVTLKDPFGSLTRDVFLIISAADLDSSSSLTLHPTSILPP